MIVPQVSGIVTDMLIIYTKSPRLLLFMLALSPARKYVSRCLQHYQAALHYSSMLNSKYKGGLVFQ